MKRCIPLLALLRLCYGGDTIDPQDLVRRAGMTMQLDWAAPKSIIACQGIVMTLAWLLRAVVSNTNGPGSINR